MKRLLLAALVAAFFMPVQAEEGPPQSATLEKRMFHMWCGPIADLIGSINKQYGTYVAASFVAGDDVLAIWILKNPEDKTAAVLASREEDDGCLVFSGFQYTEYDRPEVVIPKDSGDET